MSDPRPSRAIEVSGGTPAPGDLPGPARSAQVLAWVAGFVDTAGFLLLAGVFLAHVTGNFVLLGAAIAQNDPAGPGTLALKAAVLPVFVGGVAVGWWLHRSTDGARRVAMAQATLLAGAGLLGLIASTDQGWVQATAMLLGVLAMGLQAMLGRVLRTPMTHVMTGNVTQLTVDLLERRPIAANAWLVASFALGAAMAGLLVPLLGLASLLLPAAVLAGFVMSGSVRRLRSPW